HHDHLGIGVELVERVGDGNHQGDRGDQEDENRDEETRHADEGQDRLALIRHQVDFAQRLRHPDERRQADRDQPEGSKCRAENVLVDRRHCPWPFAPATPPTSAENRLPAGPPSALPCDRPTKWLSQGNALKNLALWLLDIVPVARLASRPAILY